MPPSNCLGYALTGTGVMRTSNIRQRTPPTPSLSSASSSSSSDWLQLRSDRKTTTSRWDRDEDALPSVQGRRRRRGGWIAAHPLQVRAGLFLLCVALYWNSLQADFVFDDVTAIRDNRDLRPHVPWNSLFANDFWGTPMNKEQSHKSYRPLTVLTFRLNYALGELNPVGYHLVNVLLHGCVTILYYSLCSKLLRKEDIASLVAATLFSVHPVSNGTT